MITSENKKRKLPSYITEEEFFTLIKTVRQPRHKLAFILAFHSGLRIAEIVALQRDSIDLAGKRIFIRQGKGGKDRVVPLPKGFPHSYLSLIPIKCGIRALQIRFKAAIIPAGITKHGLHFHSLRHSFAVRCMHQGIPLNTIQVLLGHENISTTSVYTRINPQEALDNYEKMW